MNWIDCAVIAFALIGAVVIIIDAALNGKLSCFETTEKEKSIEKSDL